MARTVQNTHHWRKHKACKGKDVCIDDSSKGDGDTKAGTRTHWCGGEYCGMLNCEFNTTLKCDLIRHKERYRIKFERDGKLLMCGGECGMENCDYQAYRPKYLKRHKMSVAPPVAKPPIQPISEEVDEAGKDECIEDSSKGEGEVKAGGPILWCDGKFCGILFCEFKATSKSAMRRHRQRYKLKYLKRKCEIKADGPAFWCGGELCGMLYCDFKTSGYCHLKRHKERYMIDFEQEREHKQTLVCGGECGIRNCYYQTYHPNKLKRHKERSRTGIEIQRKEQEQIFSGARTDKKADDSFESLPVKQEIKSEPDDDEFDIEQSTSCHKQTTVESEMNKVKQEDVNSFEPVTIKKEEGQKVTEDMVAKKDCSGELTSAMTSCHQVQLHLKRCTACLSNIYRPAKSDDESDI